MGIITVSGSGKVEVKPDTTAVSVSFSGLEPTFSQAVYVSSEKMHRLKENLRKDGIEDEMIEDRRNSIEKAEHREKDKKTDSYRNVFDGYGYEYSLVARFPIDMNRLGDILMHLSNMDVGFEVKYWYESSNIEEEKLKALELAVRDARQKASIIAEASGKKLGEPKHISDGSGRIYYDDDDYESDHRIMCCDNSMEAPPVIDSNPRDTIVSAKVETEWESI